MKRREIGNERQKRTKEPRRIRASTKFRREVRASGAETKEKGINEGELKQRDGDETGQRQGGETRGNCDNVGIASIAGMCHP